MMMKNHVVIDRVAALGRPETLVRRKMPAEVAAKNLSISTLRAELQVRTY